MRKQGTDTCKLSSAAARKPKLAAPTSPSIGLSIKRGHGAKRNKKRIKPFIRSWSPSAHQNSSRHSQELIPVPMNELPLSARAYARIPKVSRTIADLDDKIGVSPEHVSEAIQYRTFDRTLWV